MGRICYYQQYKQAAAPGIQPGKFVSYNWETVNHIINLPNTITAVRFVLAAILALMLMLNQTVLMGFFTWLLFSIAAGTDWIDGYFARRYKSETVLGQLMDPLSTTNTFGRPPLTIPSWSTAGDRSRVNPRLAANCRPSAPRSIWVTSVGMPPNATANLSKSSTATCFSSAPHWFLSWTNSRLLNR